MGFVGTCLDPGMGVHDACPAPDVVPVWHGVHFPARCDEEVPAGQAMQDDQPASA